jgi:SagB-type dehydrogenase family enzyme
MFSVRGWPTRSLATVIVALFWLAACGPAPAMPEADMTPLRSTSAPEAESLDLTDQVIALPTPCLSGSMTLEAALAQRRSVRAFSGEALTLEELGQLLWAAQGVTDAAGLRTAPSAGALYPLEVYALMAGKVYHYEPDRHQLAVHAEGDAQPGLYAAALRQEAVREAPVVIVIAAVYARTAQKYGEARGPRYVHLEAGHAAQNVLLQAVALDLGAVPIGAFSDDAVQRVLALPADHAPLYLIPVGHTL